MYNLSVLVYLFTDPPLLVLVVYDTCYFSAYQYPHAKGDNIIFSFFMTIVARKGFKTRFTMYIVYVKF